MAQEKKSYNSEQFYLTEADFSPFHYMNVRFYSKKHNKDFRYTVKFSDATAEKFGLWFGAKMVEHSVVSFTSDPTVGFIDCDIKSFDDTSVTISFNGKEITLPFKPLRSGNKVMVPRELLAEVVCF